MEKPLCTKKGETRDRAAPRLRRPAWKSHQSLADHSSGDTSTLPLPHFIALGQCLGLTFLLPQELWIPSEYHISLPLASFAMDTLSLWPCAFSEMLRGYQYASDGAQPQQRKVCGHPRWLGPLKTQHTGEKQINTGSPSQMPPPLETPASNSKQFTPLLLDLQNLHVHIPWGT